MKTGWFAAALLASSAFAAPMVAAQENETKLLRDPALSDDKLAFAYAGDIWVADADGRNPVRLTSHAATERDPVFSPDGTKIAYTANYDGNDDVFVVNVTGGEPQRLTWHPGSDEALDWLPDFVRGNFGPMLVTTSCGNEQIAVGAFRQGAADYLNKANAMTDSAYLAHSIKECLRRHLFLVTWRASQDGDPRVVDGLHAGSQLAGAREHPIAVEQLQGLRRRGGALPLGRAGKSGRFAE